MIVATLATLSSRVALLEETVASLLPQVDALAVYCNGHEQIPACLKHPKVLHAVLSREAGWRGAEAKLWFWDDTEFKAAPRWSPGDIALVCDDDIVYPPDYAKRMVEALERHPGAVVSVHGSIMRFPFESYTVSRTVAGIRDAVPEDARVHIPGSGTTAFRYGDVPISLRDDVLWSHAVDPALAILCAKKEIPCWVVARPSSWLRPLVVPQNGTSIFRQRVGGDNAGHETMLLRSMTWPDIPPDPPGFTERRNGTAAPPKSSNRVVNINLRRKTNRVVNKKLVVNGRIITENPNSMLPNEAVLWLEQALGGLPGETVVELGSGYGTKRLLNALPPGVNLVSVEHDRAFINLVQGTRYVHAPLVDGWYDPRILAEDLPRADNIRALIVDGPPKQGRSRMLEHLALFDGVPVLVDDVNRHEEWQLAIDLARLRGVASRIHHCRDGRAFATVGWKD